MGNRKKILYLMPVNWGWIKQRPHFIAEYLSDDFDVTVFEVKCLRIRDLLTKSNGKLRNDIDKDKNIRVVNYYLFDFNNRPILKYFAKVANYWIIKYKYSKELRKYDYIWLGSPKLFNRFNNYIPESAKLIYDCMDDYLEFPKTKYNKKRSKKTFQTEKELVERADLVLFSADFLQEKVIRRYGCKNRWLVVNNAIEIPKDEVYNDKCEVYKIIEKISKPLVYIGTIAAWFDFKTMISVLDKDPELNLVLVGPSNISIPNHPQIHHVGAIEHNCIFPVMKISYALIMPFEVNELIKSVNPVKLYEYIYSGKPVISVRYDETEKFKPFVQLYSDADELSTLLSNIPNVIINREKCIAYVKENTWSRRCNEIAKALMEI